MCYVKAAFSCKEQHFDSEAYQVNIQSMKTRAAVSSNFSVVLEHWSDVICKPWYHSKVVVAAPYDVSHLEKNSSDRLTFYPVLVVLTWLLSVMSCMTECWLSAE